jgi:hypothetical protein
MSDINNTLIITKPVNIRYARNYYGFSDSSHNINKYLFELIIKGKTIGIIYFKNIEDTKYSHLIKLIDNIKLSDIDSYVATITIANEEHINYELEGIINQTESNSTQRSHHMYIEFTKNDIGNTLCSCFYTGADHHKIFASPPI